MYTTLSPCDMCTGACLLYGVKRVVIGSVILFVCSGCTLIFSSENKTFMGGEEYLKSRGVEVVVLDNAESYQLMQTFIKENASQW